MKPVLKTLLICTAASASTVMGFGQGSLTPPGAPAPTMKTLDQVKAGTPISFATYVIGSPGNYFLTGNIVVFPDEDGIDVYVSGVTIDLNGFTISSAAEEGVGTGIHIYSENSDITILNGHITGGITYSGGNYTGIGFVNGIDYGGTGNVRVTGVTVTGVSSNGIALGNGNSTVVDSCLVNIAGSYGIQADTVSHSTANVCGNTAIFAQNTASDCFGFCTSSADGIFTYSNALNCTGGSSNGTGLSANNNAENCVGYSNGNGNGNGLNAGNNASNCYGNSSGFGIGLNAGNNASNCYGSSSGGGTGLNASTASNCYGNCSGSGIGLNAYTASNCYGYCNGSGDGLYIIEVASNCYGFSEVGNGLFANAIVSNCVGVSNANSTGLAAYTASYCYGQSNAGTGLKATIANSCVGSGTPNYTVTNKYNMP